MSGYAYCWLSTFPLRKLQTRHEWWTTTQAAATLPAMIKRIKHRLHVSSSLHTSVTFQKRNNKSIYRSRF